MVWFFRFCILILFFNPGIGFADAFCKNRIYDTIQIEPDVAVELNRSGAVVFRRYNYQYSDPVKFQGAQVSDEGIWNYCSLITVTANLPQEDLPKIDLSLNPIWRVPFPEIYGDRNEVYYTLAKTYPEGSSANFINVLVTGVAADFFPKHLFFAMENINHPEVSMGIYCQLTNGTREEALANLARLGIHYCPATSIVSR